MSIETSTRCSCGTFVVLGQCLIAVPGGGHVGAGWDARCPNCYAPVEDSSDREKVRGFGDTPDAALWDWQEKHDDAWDVTIEPNQLFADLERQVAEERTRQRGWGKRASSVAKDGLIAVRSGMLAEVYGPGSA